MALALSSAFEIIALFSDSLGPLIVHIREISMYKYNSYDLNVALIDISMNRHFYLRSTL
jgi:hypothetical protein